MLALKKTSPKKTHKKSKQNKTFTVGIVSPITQKGFAEETLSVIEGICQLGFAVHVLAEGDESARKTSMDLLEKFPKSFQVHESVKQNRDFILQHSDILFVPEKPKKSLVNEILAENIVPVLPQGVGFEPFDTQKETGEAFCFTLGNFWQMFQAIIKAAENFKFAYDWKNLKKNLAKKGHA